jgi:hypothetical protein
MHLGTALPGADMQASLSHNKKHVHPVLGYAERQRAFREFLEGENFVLREASRDARVTHEQSNKGIGPWDVSGSIFGLSNRRRQRNET